MNDETPTMGQLVRAGREAEGLSQDDLAERVGMSQRWVSAVEAGEIAVPRDPVMRRLASVLKLDVADLYLAAKLAKTKADARRLAAELAAIEPDDPVEAFAAELRQVDATPAELAHLRALLDSLVRARLPRMVGLGPVPQ